MGKRPPFFIFLSTGLDKFFHSSPLHSSSLSLPPTHKNLEKVTLAEVAV